MKTDIKYLICKSLENCYLHDPAGITVYYRQGCGYSSRAIDSLLNASSLIGNKIALVDCSKFSPTAVIEMIIHSRLFLSVNNKNMLKNHSTFPIIFVGNVFIGGCDDFLDFLNAYNQKKCDCESKGKSKASPKKKK